VFFYELGALARVVEDHASREGPKFVGFLLGFLAEGDRGAVGYVHLVGVHPEYRRKGVARALYTEFTRAAQASSCRRLKAITTVGNEGSLRFHQALGWTATEEEHYAGPGRRRVVFTKDL
jgi:ribosomal protein S18 acetylase RimI-like enzyme